MKVGVTSRRLILVGAGNSHLVFLRRWGMDPDPQTELILINETREIPYSAMVPGFLAGEYQREEIQFDLVRLCARRGIRLVVGEVEGIEAASKTVRVKDRAPLEFDWVSLNVGSVSQFPAGFKESQRCFGVKPLSALAARLDRLALLNPRSLVVVGGGAGGVEMALALRRRFPKASIRLVEAEARLLPHLSLSAARAAAEALARAGVEIVLRSPVTAISEASGQVTLTLGTTTVADGVVVLGAAAPHAWISRMGADCDERGFLRVNEALQSTDVPFLFGAGDTVAFPGGLPRAGVFSVRQGPVLFQNVKAALSGGGLRPYRPQRRFLTLLNTADGRAVWSYGKWGGRGRWVRRWKERIDRKWTARFQTFSPMGVEGPMTCGGCGSKVDALSLDEVVGPLPAARDFEDAALLPRGTHVQGLTIDLFRGFLEDPFRLGEIAALNALNDLWAKRIKPSEALAIVAVPEGPVNQQRRLVSELMAGAAAAFGREGVAIVGGHTTQLAEVAIGFTVVGEGSPSDPLLKQGLRPGMDLILTKPLGTGALLAAFHRGECRAEWHETLLASLRQGHGGIADLLVQAAAGTDVSGFGLARHLFEMLRQSGCGARLQVASLPCLPGAEACWQRGIFSQIHGANERAVQGALRGSRTREPILFDPQTCGGLLLGVDKKGSEKLVTALRGRGWEQSAVIGEVVGSEDPTLEVY